MNDEFLDKFKRIESFVREIEGKDNENFGEIIRNGESPYVIRNKEALDDMARVRNALSHNTTSFYIIVNDDAMNTINGLLENIPLEETANTIMTKGVIIFDGDQGIAEPLRIIKERKISQFPIQRNGKICGILTDNGISNWLASNIDNDLVSLCETQINTVLDEDELANSYRFISRKSPYSAICKLFRNIINLRALFVTEDGKDHQKLLGIITPWDLNAFV